MTGVGEWATDDRPRPFGRVELADRLSRAGAATVDVRRYSGSCRNPDVARDALARWLPQAGFDYRWVEALGGRWRLPPGEQASDPWWDDAAFRAYAARTRSAEFIEALDALLRETADKTMVLMCSESVWWRCHRRLIADVAMLRYDLSVTHLFPGSRSSQHRPADGARVRSDGVLVWDDGESVST